MFSNSPVFTIPSLGNHLSNSAPHVSAMGEVSHSVVAGQRGDFSQTPLFLPQITVAQIMPFPRG